MRCLWSHPNFSELKIWNIFRKIERLKANSQTVNALRIIQAIFALLTFGYFAHAQEDGIQFNKYYDSGVDEVSTVSFVLEDGYLTIGLTGTTEEYIFLRKVDLYGNEIWKKPLFYFTGSVEGISVIQGGKSGIACSDGTFVIVFQTLADEDDLAKVNLIRFTKEGELLDEFSYNTQFGYGPGSIIEDDQGNFVVVSIRASFPTQDVPSGFTPEPIIMKLSADFELIWEKPIATSNGSTSVSSCVLSSSGDILCSGRTWLGWNYDPYVFKANSEGDLIWFETYGTDNNDSGARIRNYSEGRYLVNFSNREESEDEACLTGKNRLYFALIDESGTIEWKKNVIPLPEYDDVPFISACDNFDVGPPYRINEKKEIFTCFHVAGAATYNRYYIAKYDSLANLLWAQVYNLGESVIHRFALWDSDLTPDGGMFAVGINMGVGVNADPWKTWMLKVDSLGNTCPDPNCSNEFPIGFENDWTLNNSFFRLYPNPAMNFVIINCDECIYLNCVLRLRDVYGRIHSEVLLNHRNYKLNLGSLKSGIYFYELTDGKQLVRTGRLLKK